MKLQRVNVTDFKAFHDLDLDLNGGSTVIAGINGVGKSTVLSAIAYLMHIWLNRLNPSQGKAFETIPPDAISIGADSLVLECDIVMAGAHYKLGRMRKAPEANKRRGSQTFLTSPYAAFTDTFRSTFLESDTGTMPIFAHYGVNRSVTNVTMRAVKEGYDDKLAALERAADNQANFQKFFEWYREQEADEAIALRQDPAYRNRSLELVRMVVSDMVDGVEDLHVRRNPTRMTAVKDGKEMRVDLLSDGEKCTLALFGDLVKRLTLANPGLENPLEGEGIVLIDEVELHLHPKWQRRILGKLKKHFPNIQFIVSTHSPQVLGEATDEYNIYIIDAKKQEVRSVSRLDVYDSNLILEEYMGTASQNPLVGNVMHEVFHLVDNGEFDRAKDRLEYLADLTGYANRDYVVARNYLKRGMYGHAISG